MGLLDHESGQVLDPLIGERPIRDIDLGVPQPLQGEGVPELAVGRYERAVAQSEVIESGSDGRQGRVVRREEDIDHLGTSPAQLLEGFVNSFDEVEADSIDRD